MIEKECWYYKEDYKEANFGGKTRGSILASSVNKLLDQDSLENENNENDNSKNGKKVDDSKK